MSKVIDYDKIIRESFLKAQKDLNLIKEEETPAPAKKSAFLEPFDEQKHMPSFQFKVTEWGLKGTTDANQIDAIIDAIVGKKGEVAKDSLERFKITLQEIVKNLGIETSAFAGLKDVPEEQQTISSLRQIIGSLQLKSLISSIIAQDPSAAGKIFEGLMSRIAGGYSSNPNDNPIEDFVDGDGNYVSLKVVKLATGIVGSKANLAKGIAKKGAVTYLVCLKDTERDTFKLKTFSFKITKDNFFYFVNGVKTSDDLTPELKAKIKKDIEIIYNALKIKSLKEAKKDRAEELEDPEEIKFEAGLVQSDIIKKYFDVEGPEFANLSDEQKATEFKKRLANVIASINIGQDLQSYYDNAVKFYKEIAPKFISSDATWKATYEDIKNNMFFKKEGSDPFKAVTWNSLNYIAKTLIDENDKFALAAIFDEDQNFRKIASDIYFSLQAGKKFGNAKEFNEALATVTNKYSSYVDKKNKLANSFNSFKNFVEKMKMAERQAKLDKFKEAAKSTKPKSLSDYMKSSIETGKSPQEDTQLSADLERFWSELSTVSVVSEAEEAEKPSKVKGETQFEVSIAAARRFAIQGGDETNYDDTYPELIVARTELFNSAQKNGEAFKNWARPLYKGMHELTQGVNRYFLEDDIAGLSAQEPGAIHATQEIITSATKITATGLKASKLTENKSNLNNLTKEARMVMEMLQRMEE